MNDINPLPPANDKFWKVGKEEADNKTLHLKRVSCLQHTFVQLGFNAECTKCHIGFQLGIGAEVKEGHIYIKGQLIV